MKKLIMLFFVLLVSALNQSVLAETRPFLVAETDSLKILLSKDGTGIIKDIECRSCDFTSLKITANSRASINGKEVSIQQARARAGKEAMVSFDPKTAEVQYIRWTEE